MKKNHLLLLTTVFILVLSVSILWISRRLPVTGIALAPLKKVRLQSAGEQHANPVSEPSPERSAQAQNAPNAKSNVLLASNGGTLLALSSGTVSGSATLGVDGKAFSPRNHSGFYERVQIAPGAKIPVELQWPPDAGDDVFVHAIQGGKIDGLSAKRFDLTKNRSIQFEFQANREPGRYEVLLRRGTQEEVLQFWVPTLHPEYDPPAIQVSSLK